MSGESHNLMRRLGRSGRRGATVVLVLGLLAVTLAVSYAMMRTQVTSLQIQTNRNRRDIAREAALTGMAAALQRIHEADWDGVDVPISGSLSDSAIYEVVFATGDESLEPSDEDYSEYPFRLTLISTGYAADPDDPGRRSEYRVEAVVQLVRRDFSADPAAWTSAKNYTLVQWANENTKIQFPARVEGAVKLGGTLDFCEEYPDYRPALVRYLSDLNQMRLGGLGDHRPFSGPVSLPFNRNSTATRNLLTDELKLTLIDTGVGGAAPVGHPGSLAAYRLYPGGKEYDVPVIPSVLKGVTLEADAIANPLGVFLSQGFLRVEDNVSIQGTVITSGSEPDIDVIGRNVIFSPPELPRLNGQPAGATVHLPAALVQDDFRLHSAAALSVQGALVVWHEFEVEQGSTNTRLAIEGRVLAKEVAIHGQNGWDLNSDHWRNLLQLFTDNLSQPNGDPYFPRWLEKNFGLQAAPKIKMTPAAYTATHRWQDWSQPVYVPAAGDQGLLWDLLRWKESA